MILPLCPCFALDSLPFEIFILLKTVKELFFNDLFPPSVSWLSFASVSTLFHSSKPLLLHGSMVVGFGCSQRANNKTRKKKIVIFF